MEILLRLPVKSLVRLKCVCSCRGFLLLNSDQSLWVWNPSTGVHRKLPSTLIESDLKTFLQGFGYDPSTDDYLVVRVSCKPKHATNGVEFFSFRTNVWTHVEVTHLSYINDLEHNKGGLLLNGAIHWLVCRFDEHNVTGWLVVFDLTERSISEMLLPSELLNYCDFDSCELVVLGDLLSLSFVDSDSSVEMWVMEKYGDQSSWNRAIAVYAEHFVADTHFFPICYTKDGDIFGSDGWAGLAKYSFRGQQPEHRSYYDGRCGLEVAVYTESLLSFPVTASKQTEEDE
ncbi:F-box/kelch-repeat protein At3g06240-like isoform X2 [Vigna unguiculata]|uniref:F-box/kelch-repeat protein At3g06240-like isoform X2 n=1 Tax=Vigna unguiculata TaxID=3917 RepID=UPI001015DDFD|nr:F-box/kelch-repeat protein At3g06240-like isoform X2 [Vigna unguiculata]